MLRNYLKIALRNIQKNTVYSFINIFGLAIGITCSILILLWVYDEVSFDNFHSNRDRIHQVWINAKYDGAINSWTSVPLPTAEALKTADSNIKYAITTDWGDDHLLTVGETRMTKRGFSVEEEFLEMLQFPLISGTASQVLDDPHAIVITESTAKAIFGDADPINKVIRVDDLQDMKVTGVLKDIPGNSSYQFDYLLSFKFFEQQDWVKSAKNNWGNYSFPVVVELQPGASEEGVEENIKGVLAKNGQTDIEREFFLHPMSRWRLHSSFKDGVESGGLIEYVNMFSLLGIFILMIACINFMNLATARSERRAREVGIRKSVGSRRKDIVVQFLGEATLISIFAFLCALAMTELSLPLYNMLISKKLSIDYTSAFFWMMAVGIIFFTGLISGSYPAFYLSSFNVTRTLKGSLQAGKAASTPRKVLVVLQFVLSITLIVCSIVIQQQIEHVSKREIGYNKENLITVTATVEIRKQFAGIKNDLLRTGVVESVTKSNSPITGIYSNNFVDWPGKPADQRYSFATISTDYDYTKTMGIKILEGRDFSEEYKSDTSAIIINKTGIELMGLQDPIGEEVTVWGDKRHIVGVVDNVLMGSLFHEISPMFLVLIPDWASAVTIRVAKTDDLQASLKKIETVFRKHNPAYPFEYTFVDQDFARKFSNINMMRSLASVFTVLAIVITGLGLFGLAAFTAEQRTKEVGIRKVLGATVTNLILLITREFTALVIVAFVIAGPLAYWGSLEMLENYPVRVAFPIWVLPAAGGIALLLTLIIVSTQAFRAASANPVKSLRSE
jgi:putative ABC transport system permease protein